MAGAVPVKGPLRGITGKFTLCSIRSPSNPVYFEAFFCTTFPSEDLPDDYPAQDSQ